MGKTAESNSHHIDRYQIEETFHDEWAKSIDLDELLVKESFENKTAVENRYALDQMGRINGKRILDLGCGAGETSIYFALKGADVYAVDISSEMIKLVKKLSQKYKVQLKTAQMKAEHLEFDTGFFDFVFGNGVLHHVDLFMAAAEVNRVLKQGGKAIFIEPLAYNPVIEIYRKIAAEVRTPTEHPLNFRQINSLRHIFRNVYHKEFWFFSLAIFAYFYFILRASPSKERYWKKVIKDYENFSHIYDVLYDMDSFLLKYVPFLRYFCWNTVIILE
jgi:2-polyprenyl-3-methyl-5-hydroxy-6-metoxy-1,4-benzoquinol methylase